MLNRGKRVWLLCRRALAYPAVRCIVTAFFLNLLLEILNQRSIPTAFARFVTEPTLMFYNYLLILATLSLSGLFRRQIFAMTVLCVPWLSISIANFVLQCFRNTPLSAVDFKLLFSVIYIMDVYLTVWQMVLILVVIVLAIALLVVLFFKLGKQARHWKSSLSLIGVCAVLLAVLTPLLLHMGVLSNSYSNLTKAYRDYGLPYCFLVSIIDHGIDEPEDYSGEVVDAVLDEIDASLDENKPSGEDTASPEVAPDPAPTEEQEPEPVQPNVIFLQLESFIDVNELTGLTFSENPVPYFTELKQTCPGGGLSVPTYGAGTVNTEFEVLTGMNLDYFGAGEYPYITVLLDQTCESICYNLRENGYTSTAIHNNTATFYDRNLVFANLGFDRFVSEEYMYDLSYTSVGWPKDECLTDEILKSLSCSESLDLIYAISVQPHGKYPTDPEQMSAYPIQITAGFTEEEQALQAAYTYYINQLREVDDFLRSLTAALSDCDEPVMLVLYGDHLPNFELEESDVSSGDLFRTEYVIWTNYALDTDNCDLEAYQLSAYIMELIGCDTGVLTRLHQTRADNENYQEDLEMLEYDMLFGDMRVWGGTNPYAPTALQMGYGDITLLDAAYLEGEIYLSGKGFNASSVVFFGDTPQETVLINRNTLHVSDALPATGEVITVRQTADDGTPLSSTNGITVSDEFWVTQPPRDEPLTDDPDPGEPTGAEESDEE